MYVCTYVRMYVCTYICMHYVSMRVWKYVWIDSIKNAVVDLNYFLLKKVTNKVVNVISHLIYCLIFSISNIKLNKNRKIINIYNLSLTVLTVSLTVPPYCFVQTTHTSSIQQRIKSKVNIRTEVFQYFSLVKL